MLTHTRNSHIAGLAVIVPAITFGTAPPAAAEPTPGGQPADQIISELGDEGYTVAINWVGGASTLPLDRCQVNSIHNPNRGVPPLPKSSVTVYVDVQCPDESSNS
ncbi:hypothetical protein [Mycolicibacterium neworleansense]|uniref:PASTA domain-containing protein n=1 Tax=Mycolicibacterium neworleansense TaxID=146018 RepID=A0A0H5RI20_9MYCO|nr:hypothetical protein [Mycolicibacterium neworleansense]MCV7362202.1 hypothetical protein [Mycolicibacterium neworleansense]CRZ13391.1 hypothetical protein BN2156_00223 [Mycolicibacterium neworleansense]